MTADRPAYDSRADTLLHSLRVGALMVQAVKEIADRAVQHDLSKTQEPELATFDRVGQRLADLTYGTDEYRESLADMRPALEHHYAVNPHHPEHHSSGILGMTLVDLIEMLADWKASTERVTDGDLRASIDINAKRFGYGAELRRILLNTAEHLGWVDPTGSAPASPTTAGVVDLTAMPLGGTDTPVTPAWVTGS